MDYKKETTILIPSLSPDEKLLGVIRDGKNAGFERILVVNDGSDQSYEGIFLQAKQLGAVVIVHAVNMGKGRALKTGMNYIVNEWPECKYVVTVDSDGQHRVGDIEGCLRGLMESPDALVLGSRDFSGGNVPFRSRYGNRITAKVMKLLVGCALSDTQTGLRAFSTERAKDFLTIRGERFDYEMNMLLFAKEQDIPMKEVTIETVYIEENKSSHFRPFQDSIKIYALFLKYLFASLSSFVIDILFFSLFIYLLQPIAGKSYILQSTVLARIISSMFNFLVNRKGVFRSKDNFLSTLVRYYTLAVLQMFVSGGIVSGIHALLPWNESFIKVVVDCVLFFVSFTIQREWVFKGGKRR